MDLSKVDSIKQADILSVVNWCEEIYNTRFAKYFQGTRELYAKLQDRKTPITTDELEDLLTTTPLHLFSVSEELNNLRLSYEVVKLTNKSDRRAAVDDLISKGVSQSKANESVSLSVESKILEDAYNTVITRVENEISFSRELIMAAKKIWDSREHGEKVNPVSPVDLMETESKLPEFYIKGV